MVIPAGGGRLCNSLYYSTCIRDWREYSGNVERMLKGEETFCGPLIVTEHRLKKLVD